MGEFTDFIELLIGTYLLWFVRVVGIVVSTIGLANWAKNRQDEDKAMKFIGILVTGSIIFGTSYLIQFIYDHIGSSNLDIL